jgi:hypothetical protein
MRKRSRRLGTGLTVVLLVVASLAGVLALRSQWSSVLIAWAVKTALEADEVRVEIARLDWTAVSVTRLEIIEPASLAWVQRIEAQDLLLGLTRRQFWSRPAVDRIAAEVLGITLDTSVWVHPVLPEASAGSPAGPAATEWSTRNIDRHVANVNAALAKPPWLPAREISVERLTVVGSDPRVVPARSFTVALGGDDGHVSARIETALGEAQTDRNSTTSASPITARLIAAPNHFSLTLEQEAAPPGWPGPPRTLLAAAYNHEADATTRLLLHSQLPELLTLIGEAWPAAAGALPVLVDELLGLSTRLIAPVRAELGVSVEHGPTQPGHVAWELVLSGLRLSEAGLHTAPLQLTGEHRLRTSADPLSPPELRSWVALETERVTLADNALQLLGVGARLEPQTTRSATGGGHPVIGPALNGELRVTAIDAPDWGLHAEHWRDHQLTFTLGGDTDHALPWSAPLTLSGRLNLLGGALQAPVRAGASGPARWQFDVDLEPVRLAAVAWRELLPRHWPALLHFESGEFTLRASIRGGDTPVTAHGVLALSAADLIYDWLYLQGVSVQAPLQFESGQALQIELPGLRARRAHVGVEFTDVVVDGGLRMGLAPSARLLDADTATGTLSLRRGEAAFAGGLLRVDPLTALLGADWPVITVHVEGVELEQLFAMLGERLPISGQGTLDGRLPVRLSDQGLTVEQGELLARPPGGHLAYSAAGDAPSPPGPLPPAALALRALSDFRYHHFATQVDYDQQGTLVLGIALRGHSPAIGAEQALSLNITVEQNLPTLLASLQLAARLSDRIEARIREIFQ